jgi:hypothetical protein
MEVLLVARSIGKRSAGEPLSREGHAGLVFDLGRPAASDHWIAQAGPSDGVLLGTLGHCSSEDWYRAFAQASGAVWETGGSATLPVSVLLRTSVPAVDSARLAAITDGINGRRFPYRYDPGPNSNTFVRMFLEALAVPVPRAPMAAGFELRGWGWEPPVA